MDRPDEEKLQRIFDVLREPRAGERPPIDLQKEWPGLVERASADALREERARRNRMLGALAVAALVVVVAGVAWWVSSSKQPRFIRDEGPTVGIDLFPSAEADLLRETVLEDGLRAVSATADQRSRIAAIVSETRPRVAGANTGEIARIQSAVRAEIGAALDPEQRKKLEAFTAERDRLGHHGR